MPCRPHPWSGIIAVCASLACQAQAPLVGTWELVQVAPQAIQNTVPNGVTNVKMHFTADGKLYTLRPEAVTLAGAAALDYSFDGRTLVVSGKEMRQRRLAVTFPDPETMVFTQANEAQRTFKRLPSFDQKREPRSLQTLLHEGDSGAAPAYDSHDYSRLPLAERVLGVWEVQRFEKVPRDQAPPYGFLNDLWVIDRTQVTVTRRHPPATEAVPYSLAKGRLASSAISLGAPVGSRIEWTPSFNEWGHLVLDSWACRVTLKLVSKDPKASAAIPFKVVLLQVD